MPKNKRRKMKKRNDIKDFNEYGIFEFHSTPGWIVHFELPEPVDKEFVERIKEKISDDAKDRN